MSHTDIEQHHGYSVHGTGEKHDTGKWIGSFHIARHGIPTISISVIGVEFASAEEAALHALRQGKTYIDTELNGTKR